MSKKSLEQNSCLPHPETNDQKITTVGHADTREDEINYEIMLLWYTAYPFQNHATVVYSL